MHRDTDLSTRPMGLLAQGSSGRWDVEIDEAIESGFVTMEIDNGNIYLVFHLSSLTVVRKALAFLERTAPVIDRSRRLWI